MNTIIENGKIVVPRIVRDYAARSFRTFEERILALETNEANLVDRYGDSLIKTPILEGHPELVALALEGALIECVGKQNCCNKAIPKNRIIDTTRRPRPQDGAGRQSMQRVLSR